MVFGHFVLVANIIYIYSNNKYIPTYINYHFISENRNILHFSSNISNYYNFKYAFSFLVEYFIHLFWKINVISKIKEFYHYFIKIGFIFPVLISPPKLKNFFFINLIKRCLMKYIKPIYIFHLEINMPRLPGLFSLFCMCVCVCVCLCVCFC